MDKLPESTNSPAASLASEPEKLLPVTQDDIDAALELVSPHEARRIAARTCDDHMLVQAFARRAQKARLSYPVSGTDMVMVPREPTEAMMDAGLYHSSHDSEYGDVHSVWKGMFDAATLSGGSSAYAIAAPGIEPLDGNDIWEALFGILKGDVPDALTEEVCSKLATALSASPTPPIPMIAEAGERDEWTVDEIRASVRATIDAPGCSHNQFCREKGITPAKLSEFLSGKRGAEPGIIGPIGFRLAIVPHDNTVADFPAPIDAETLLARALRDQGAQYEKHAADVEKGRSGPIFKAALTAIRAALSTPATLDNTAVEGARVAAFHAIYGKQADPFTRPESYEYASEVADAVLATLTAKTEKAE